MAKLIEKTYAQALFEVATEMNGLDLYREELSFIVETFKTYQEFSILYNTPQMSKEEKKEMIEDVFKNQISKEVMNFLKILVDKNRTTALEGINKEYKNLVNKHYNQVEGVVITAIPLKDEYKATIEEKLSTITKSQVTLKNEVDSSIIGGVFVKIEDRVIDHTIKNRLDQLKKELTQIIV
ncbi:F0F1 ATP synthase subunit delta [Inediibacterium massiliense]|uniref:F0F1 ATP synthase subunit delta n=1 Tax=Inediibacterium massiliense TaxID=1658111 RepID=UPI0006B40314|nr:F0F1 ATP synthase subunit delta [Inediibacterium massiliense]